MQTYLHTVRVGGFALLALSCGVGKLLDAPPTGVIAVAPTRDRPTSRNARGMTPTT